MAAKILQDVIIKWAKEKEAHGDIEFNEKDEAFRCDKFIRY